MTPVYIGSIWRCGEDYIKVLDVITNIDGVFTYIMNVTGWAIIGDVMRSNTGSGLPRFVNINRFRSPDGDFQLLKDASF